MINTRTGINIILLSVAILLAVILIVSGNSQQPRSPEYLSEITPDTINVIRIDREGRDELVLNKSSEGWVIAAPVQVRANRIRITSILSVLHSPVLTSFQADPDTLHIYGLASPQVSLFLDDMELHFGDTNTMNQGRYILYEDKIYLIEDDLYPQLRQDTGFFVNTIIVEDTPLSVSLACINQDNQAMSRDILNEFKHNWANLEAVRVTTLTPPSRDLGNIILETATGKGEIIAISTLNTELILTPVDTGLHYWLAAGKADELGLSQSGCTE